MFPIRFQTKKSIPFFSIFAIIVLVFAGSAENLIRAIQQKSSQPGGYSTTFMCIALNTNTVKTFLPVISVLSFSGTYVDDMKSKFVRFYLIRTDIRKYLWSRTLTCVFYGGSIVFLGEILSWGISVLIFLPAEGTTERSTVSDSQLWEILGLFFLSGGLWAVVGMTMSTFMESKYIAYASPFIIYYLLVILCERYFPNAALLYPPNWTNPDVWPFGALGAAIFLLELTAICGIVFIMRAGKRLREL